MWQGRFLFFFCVCEYKNTHSVSDGVNKGKGVTVPWWPARARGTSRPAQAEDEVNGSDVISCRWLIKDYQLLLADMYIQHVSAAHHPQLIQYLPTVIDENTSSPPPHKHHSLTTTTSSLHTVLTLPIHRHHTPFFTSTTTSSSIQTLHTTHTHRHTHTHTHTRSITHHSFIEGWHMTHISKERIKAFHWLYFAVSEDWCEVRLFFIRCVSRS